MFARLSVMFGVVSFCHYRVVFLCVMFRVTFFMSCSGLTRTSIDSPVKPGNDREKKKCTGMTGGGKSGNDTCKKAVAK